MPRNTTPDTQTPGSKRQADPSYPAAYPSEKKKKAHAGTVQVEVFQERLRLRWRYLGKRYCLSLGYPDSKANRTVAEGLAKRIEGEMLAGVFDQTLIRYKPQREQNKYADVVKLWEAFTQQKAKSGTVTEQTLYSTYGPITSTLKRYGKSIKTREEGEAFVNWLRDQASPNHARKQLTLLNACFNWAVAEGLIAENAIAGFKIKVPPKQPPKPFTREEISAILEGFKQDKYYSHYFGFVLFLLSTGCRPGEAAGLRWKHLNQDCSTVWIGESFSNGVFKSTKTNRARDVDLTPKLQNFLQQLRKGKSPASEDLVFSTPQGHPIDIHNFRNRAWKKVLIQLEIDYRKPYTTRHSVISHALDLGMNPVAVATLTGHDVETLYRSYAGNVQCRPMLPEL